MLQDGLKPFPQFQTEGFTGSFMSYLIATSFVRLNEMCAIEAWVIGNLRSRAMFLRRFYGPYSGLRRKGLGTTYRRLVREGNKLIAR